MPAPYADAFFDPIPRADGFGQVLGTLRAALIKTKQFNARVLDIRSVSINQKSVAFGAGVNQATRQSNQQILNAAVAQAGKQKKPLFLPAGRIEVEAPGDVVQVFTDPVTIIGSGSAVTTIHFGPDNVTDYAAGVDFHAFTATQSLRIEGLTLEGPNTQPPVTKVTITDSKGTHEDLRYRSMICIYQIGANAYVRLYDVNVSGWFTEGVYLDHPHSDTNPDLAPGPRNLDIAHAKIQTFAIPISSFCPTPQGQQVRMRNTALCLTQPFALNFAGVASQHLMYIHPNVSVDLDGCAFGAPPLPNPAPASPPALCSFSGKARYGLHHFSSGGAKPGAQYTRITNCRFTNMETGILTSGGAETEEVARCSFGSDWGISLHSPLIVRECVFAQSGITTAGDGGPHQVHIDACQFKGAGKGIDTGFKMAGSYWTVENCQFEGTGPYPLIIHTFSPTDDPLGSCQSTLRIRNSKFSVAAGRWAILGGKRLIIEPGTVFSGSGNGIAIDDTVQTHDCLTTINGLDASGLAGRLFNAQNTINKGVPGPRVYVDGSGNRFSAPSTDPKTLTQAPLVLLADGNQGGGLLCHPAVFETPVTPDNNGKLWLSYDYQAYRLSGGTIRFIYVGAEDGLRAFAGWVLLMGLGAVEIHVSDALHSGNIAWLKNGRVVKLQPPGRIALAHDPSTQCWYEIDL